MTTLILFFAAIATTAYLLGRVHERHLADIHADDRALDERLRRPVVTVADAGPALTFTRQVILEEAPPTGRHDPRVVRGSSAQRARWRHTPTHQFHALVVATWTPEERLKLTEATT